MDLRNMELFRQQWPEQATRLAVLEARVGYLESQLEKAVAFVETFKSHPVFGSIVRKFTEK